MYRFLYYLAKFEQKFFQIFWGPVVLCGLLLSNQPSQSILNEVDLFVPSNTIHSLNGKKVFIYDVKEVVVREQKKNPEQEKINRLDIKTKRPNAQNSIFVEALQAIRMFPERPKFNFYDSVIDRTVRPEFMLKAHLRCSQEFDDLPRKILKTDKKVKFGKDFDKLFKKD